MRVDFHLHSTASDGTMTPEELAEHVRGLAAAALTDHDESSGVGEFVSAAEGPARRFAGAELSIRPPEGFDTFHLLALGFDPANAELEAYLRRMRDNRDRRNKFIFENFSRLGIAIDEREMLEIAHGGVLARPHFARWLMNHRYVKSISEAFAVYLADDAPAATNCYAEREHGEFAEAARIIHAAGGIAVMAHPRLLRRAWKRTHCDDFAAVERCLAELRELGLDGVETAYSSNAPEETVEFSRMADRLGLVKSAGSDFHGANKPDVRAGMEVDDGFIAPLLERLSSIVRG